MRYSHKLPIIKPHTIVTTLLSAMNFLLPLILLKSVLFLIPVLPIYLLYFLLLTNELSSLVDVHSLTYPTPMTREIFYIFSMNFWINWWICLSITILGIILTFKLWIVIPIIVSLIIKLYVEKYRAVVGRWYDLRNYI